MGGLFGVGKRGVEPLGFLGEVVADDRFIDFVNFNFFFFGPLKMTCVFAVELLLSDSLSFPVLLLTTFAINIQLIMRTCWIGWLVVLDLTAL